MLFAQTTGVDAAAWVQVAVQLGALGILGFFMLKVQPSIASSDRKARMEELQFVAKLVKDERTDAKADIERVVAAMDAITRKPLCNLPAGWTPMFTPPHRQSRPQGGTGESG